MRFRCFNINVLILWKYHGSFGFAPDYKLLRKIEIGRAGEQAWQAGKQARQASWQAEKTRRPEDRAGATELQLF